LENFRKSFEYFGDGKIHHADTGTHAGESTRDLIVSPARQTSKLRPEIEISAVWIMPCPEPAVDRSEQGDTGKIEGGGEVYE